MGKIWFWRINLDSRRAKIPQKFHLFIKIVIFFHSRGFRANFILKLQHRFKFNKGVPRQTLRVGEIEICYCGIPEVFYENLITL